MNRLAHNEQPVNAPEVAGSESPGPADYAAAGFRILPIASDGSKRPLVDGFGKDAPDFTIAPETFGPNDGVAILTGPCPALGSDWLAVLDLDGATQVGAIDAWVGVRLPPTLSSKGYRHLYYRVPPSPEREAMRQWVRIFGRKEGAPEVDLKWAGGYAIEPAGGWDSEWDPERIAPLPIEWIRAVLRLRNAAPGPSAQRAAAPAVYTDMGDLEALRATVSALAACWPQPGEGCHEAALALGGILGDSHWSEDDIARFAASLFLTSGTKNRVSDVLTSVATRRAGGEAKGWPSLRACLKDAARGDYDAALRGLRAAVPGLKAAPVTLPEAVPVGARAAAGGQVKQLVFGSDDEIAERILAEDLPATTTVYDEGHLWRFEAETGVWVKYEPHQTSKLIEVYDGAEYLNPEGKARRVQLGSGKVASIRARIEAKLTQPGFFATAERGLAFQNGFLRLPSRDFVALNAGARARWRLPCDFGPDAARRAPPVNWVRYLRSIWGQDVQSIELVHQMLGYLLSGRHDLQKIFVLLGPPRAGKGTLLNLIGAIFGEQAGAFKVARLDQEFSMQSMLGKSVCYDPDVRRASSIFKSEGQMVERLLSISSHDVQVIPRKGIQDVVAALPARLLLAANPPFGLSDSGGALASRFIILTFPLSFLGSEDTGLGARLAREIPSIVALALDGLDRLDRVGHFIEPASSAEERASVERAQNPMLSFLEECCELGADYSAACDEVWAAACRWRETNGHKRMSSQAFSEFLRQRGVIQIRPRAQGERLPRVYRGMRLLSGSGATPALRLVPSPDPDRPVGSKRPTPADPRPGS
jgi:P4 family phage/plasmid primase-like protien